MKKILVASLGLLAVTLPASSYAYDSYQLTGLGLFGGRPSQDGTVDLRNVTTEPFNPIRGQSVVDRPRPDYAPTPIDIASFQLFPSIDLASYYDSNIYTTRNNTKDDLVYKLDPAVSLVSNWNRHALAFTAFSDTNTYTSHNKEDFTGGVLQAQGRYDLAPQTWLAGNAGYQRDTEPRSNPDVLGNTKTPTQYDLVTAGAEGYRGVGLIQTKLDYDFAYYDYSPVGLIGGGEAIQSGRNRLENGLRSEFLYSATENFKPFIRVGGSNRDYTALSQRTSTGYRVDAGTKSDFGGIITTELYAGYLDRNYYHFTDGNIGVTDFGGKLLWNVTELTSVEFEAQRSIEETALGGFTAATAASSYVTSGGSVSVTHELRRDTLLEGNFAYTVDDFQRSVQKDGVFDVGAGARYFINRNLYTDATYDYQRRASNVSTANYDRQVVLLRVGIQY